MGQRKYPIELRDRATRMMLEALADPVRSKGAIRRIAGELGIHPEALHTLGAAGGSRPGNTARGHHSGGRAHQGAGVGGPRAEAGQRDLEECLGFFRGGGPHRTSR